MSQVTVTKKNESIVRVHAEPSILQEISDLFEFEVPGAKFSPKFKSGFWNGRIRIFSMLTGELPLGLLSKVYAYCKESGYEFVDECELVREDLIEDDWNEFIDHLTFCSKGEPIAAHSYQIDSTYTALTRGRSILLSPTGSGKSLMIYMMIRWHEIQERKQLIIVPSVQLVEQMYNDFDDYATEDTWDVSKSCAKIYGNVDTNSVVIETEDGKQCTFLGIENIKLINSSTLFKQAKDITYEDQIDDKWLRARSKKQIL